MTEQKEIPSLTARILGHALFVALLLVIVAGVEIAGWGYLKYTGKDTYRLFVKRGAVQEAKGLFDTSDSFSYLDPLLSHAHNPAKLKEKGLASLPGFAVFGETENPEALTIVALGGSTTDPLAAPSWPRIFADLLAQQGIRAKVLNGGVAGYSSNQELLKLIRDVLPLQPDLVISLNGVNDLGFMHSVPQHPMVHPYQRRILAILTGSNLPPSPLMPNAVSAVVAWRNPAPDIGLNLGTIVTRTDYEQWFSNVRAMHAIATEFGIPYRCFLQPVLGVGHYDIDSREQAMLDRTIGDQASRRDYLADAQQFYAGARTLSGSVSYIIDLTDIFAGQKNMYRDARHQTVEGRERIAQVILDYGQTSGILIPAQSTRTPRTETSPQAETGP